MMRVVSFGVFICRMITVASSLQSVHTKEEAYTLDASESRYHSNPAYPQRDDPNYNNGIRRKDFEGSLNFKVSNFADTKWPNRDGYNRRTFFHDFLYDHDGTTTPFPTFYQLMTSLFGRGDGYPDEIRYNRDRATPPYPFENPYNFRPTEPNYIPPPKPIRASVIKLESITRSPLYSSFETETTTKYFHNVGTLLNHVLIENSKSPQYSGFHPQEPVDEVKIPPFKPLPKPRYTSPTVIPSRLPLHHYNKTDYKYPESVQDQLPHLQFDDPKIPYVSEKPIPQIFDTLPTEVSLKEPFSYTRSPDLGATTNILGLIDVKGLNLSGPNSERGERRPGEERFQFEGPMTKSFPGAVEKVERPAVGFTKKVSTYLDKSSVERVTNLTVQGLSKIGKENFSPHKHINYLNMRDLIGYEMSKLESTSEQSGTDNSSKRLVNLNDELSLDAKILKDTNWDGFSLSQSEEVSTPTAKPKKNKPAFWEIGVTESTTPPFTENTKPTTIFATERGRSETTTELWFATKDSTETSEPATTTEETATPKASKLAQRRPGSLSNPELSKAVTGESGTLDQIILTERTPKRRYSRRPKIVNFTPYPTTEEIQKRLSNRNHFPKRQKPNITLAFGNKNVLKSNQSFGKDEVMKFSDEEVRRRKKIGKRRQLYERVRASTSEQPVREDLL